MKLLPPKSGTVIRYAYLWADEMMRGQEEANKDRPVLVVAMSIIEIDGTAQVLVVPITHSRPGRKSDAVPLPDVIKRRLGLDELESWIVTTEANAFVWPGPDLRPVPGRSPSTIAYGSVPPSLLAEVARSYLANRERQRAAMVPRSD